MASLNKVFLMGNLTREAALRFTPGGTAVCEFGLAVNRRFTVNGQEKDEPCFVDIVVWSKQAESCSRFLEKGSPVFIEGRLQYDQWDDKETGGKRSRLRVVAERVQFLGRGAPRDESGQDYPDGDQGAQPPRQQGGFKRQDAQPPRQGEGRDFPPRQQAPSKGMPVDEAMKNIDDIDDDIPF